VKFQPGSIGWLMRHEWRLYRRGLNAFGGNGVIIFVLVALHLLAILAALGLRHLPALPQHTAAVALTFGGVFVLLLMISRGLVTAVQALYARGDMDLMLSSPIAPRSIITVRASIIAAAVTLEFGILIWPFADVFVLFGRFEWLKAYVLLPALGALATSISLLLALILFHLFGARRTRVIAQVMSAFIAVGFTLLSQLPNIMGRQASRGSAAGLRAVATHAPSVDSALWVPALAVMNGFLPTLAIAATCGAIFLLTTRRLADGFIRASVASAGVSANKRARSPGAALQFSSHARWVLIRKELRLIARDPWLLTQLLQQCVFLLPMGIVLWRGSGGHLPIIWGVIILIAGSAANSLAWITLSAEDSPELVAAAPIAAGEVVRVKLEAALLPILPLVLLPVLVLWRSHGWFGFSVSVCAAGAALCCAALNVRDRTPGNRRDFRTRYKGRPGRGFVELAVVGVWAGVCALMVWASPWR
jgi:ABC-2 type transport system permease protein